MGLDSTLQFAADHPAFAGHFPGAPIVPGVLLLDAALHALEGAQMQVTGVASVKFLQPVTPGQSLALAGEVTAPGRCTMRISHSGQPVVVAQVLTA